MGAIIEALTRLQDIERKLAEKKDKQASYRRQIRACRRQAEKNEADRESHHQQVTKCQMEIDRIDLNIKSLDESMGKHRLVLNAAKSNKEYAAILTAINTEKADSTKQENRVLQLMAEIDQLREGGKRFDDEHEKIASRQRRIEQQLEKYVESTRSEMEDLEQQQKNAAAEVPPSMLQTFIRVAERHEGEAMARLARVSPRSDDFVCGGCNMSVPLEQANRLSNADEVQVCQCCGRIFFLAPAAT